MMRPMMAGSTPATRGPRPARRGGAAAALLALLTGSVLGVSGCNRDPVSPAAPPSIAPAAAPVPPPAQAQSGSGPNDGPYVLGGRLPQAAPATPPDAGYREIEWERLVPPGWDPMKALGALDFNAMSDSDPRAMIALRQLQDAWKDAPVNEALDGSPVRIAGFVVPLDNHRDEMKEFLLVPYFGACIHVPPPPSNQIIHVVPPAPVKGIRAMDAVWVSGRMTIARADTAMGSSGYRMSGDAVQAYVADPGRPGAAPAEPTPRRP